MALLFSYLRPFPTPLSDHQCTVELVAPNGSRKTALTDARGQFQIPRLPPGEYRVKASLEGFGTVTRDIVIRPGQAATVRMVLGGPISPGEPFFEGGGRVGEGGGGGSSSSEDAPLPSEPAPQPDAQSGSVVVAEREFADDVVLQTWLNQETSRGYELQAVVPLDKGLSLFVFEQRPEPARCTVIVDWSTEDRLDPGRLAARIEQHTNKTFLGLHRIASGTAALVFRDVR